ncbi:haloacid dehalogenase-like hydrolase, putative [Verrucomicrobiia bacterium DG1235]|nr:haloacid dehalogenase-like hydrolase, putative [Verrucomicrobiae bacterium DG1235]
MKAIIFDLDETLIDRTSTARKFLGDQYDRLADRLNCQKDDFIETVIKHQKNGYADKLVAYEQSCTDLKESIAHDLHLDFRMRYGADAISFPGTLSTLEELSDNYTLAIITNGRSSGQNSKIDSTGIRRFFSAIKISEEEGIKKPNEEIYIRCLSDLGLSSADCLFIGDNPLVDVIPPKKLGMKAVWVRSIHNDEPKEADAIVDSVVDLPNLLKRMNRAQPDGGHNSGSSAASLVKP